MMRFLLVCLGGAAGSGARYLVTLGATAAFGDRYPLGTLIVNVVGSFLAGVAFHALPDSDLRAFVSVGVLGGFTTYSTFNQQSLTLLRGPSPWLGVVSIVTTFVLCLVAGMAGMWVGRR
jgi:fluoride exporter